MGESWDPASVPAGPRSTGGLQGQATICSPASCLLEALSQLCPRLVRASTRPLTSIFVWIQGPTMLAWLANWRRRCSLDCCLLCSSRRAWSRLGTSCCTWGGARSGSRSSQDVSPLTWPALPWPCQGALPTFSHLELMIWGVTVV